MEQSFALLVIACAGKRRLRSVQSYACTLRFNADDTCAPFMQPAPCGTTHDKLTSNYRFELGSRVFATPPAFCLSPPSHGSKASERQMSLVCHDLCHAGAIIARRAFADQLASCAPPSAGSLAAASSSLR